MNNFKNKHELNSIEIEQFNNLYNSIDTPSIFQNFEFNKINTEKKNYFFITENNSIICYLIVLESQLTKLKFIKSAKIISEPISKNNDLKNNLIAYVLNYYISRKFAEVNISLLKSRLKLKEQDNIKNKVSNRKTGTILINLNQNFSENFSNRLRKNIKSGKNKGVTSKIINNIKDIEKLVKIHVQMSNFKKIQHYSNKQMYNILKFVIEKEQGFIMGCFYNEILIGGIVCFNQGTTTEYFIGISHPEYRKLPINHLGLYESILHAKKNGLITFDLGGVVLNANIDSQLYSIGEFKKDFNKNIIEYHPEIKFITNSIRKFIKNLYLTFSKSLNK